MHAMTGSLPWPSVVAVAVAAAVEPVAVAVLLDLIGAGLLPRDLHYLICL